MKNIIIVPAKAESKRLKDKNWLKIGGETLFERALYRARGSGLGEVAFVSDSPVMVERVEKKNFLSDYVIDLPEGYSGKRAVNSCVYALERLKRAGESFDNIIVTLPTSPLATFQNLQEAYLLFANNERNVLGSFTEVKGRPKLWTNRNILFPGETVEIEIKPILRPLSRLVWKDNGAVYISNVSHFVITQEWFGNWVVPYFMNEIYGIDIDTQLDYLMAKTIYETKEMVD